MKYRSMWASIFWTVFTFSCGQLQKDLFPNTTGTGASTGNCAISLMGGASNCSLALSLNLTTIGGPTAGTILSGDTDATSNAALFSSPSGITTDGSNLYISDSNKIRKMDIVSGIVTTIAGPPQGSNTGGDADGTNNAALFAQPLDITTDGKNLYVADTNNYKIRQISISTGVSTTLAGPAQGCSSSCPSGDIDGSGNAARFYSPSGITTDGTNLYVADYNNNKIRQIVISTGVVTTIAGPGQGSTTAGDTDGTGNIARFYLPSGVTTDGTNLYVADGGNRKIRQIVIATGAVTTLAGPAQGCYPSCTSSDTDGTSVTARFGDPYGITTDGTNLYVSDALNNKVRKILITAGAVTTIIGPSQGSSSSGDNDGFGNTGRFTQPRHITTNGSNLYIVDWNNKKIRKIQ